MDLKPVCSLAHPKSSVRYRRLGKGFTLLELLVSTAVLAVMAVMVAQITNSAAATIGHHGKRLDADTQARLIFNRMAVDFAKMVKRPDVDCSTFKQPGSTLPAEYGPVSQPANLQAGNDRFAFYSETDGYFSGNVQPAGTGRAAVSLVTYHVSNDPYSGLPVLRRMSKGLGWEPDPANNWESAAYLPVMLTSRWPAIFGDDPDYKTVGDQVFRIEYAYLLKATTTRPARLSAIPWDTSATPAHTWIGGLDDVAAVVVAVAVLDTKSRVLVRDYDGLVGAFPDAQEGKEIAAVWNPVVCSPDFATTAHVPKAAASAVRIYQRYFYLDH